MKNLALAGIALSTAIFVSLPAISQETEQAEGIRFGQHDVRGEGEVGVITAASASSKNGVTLLVRTTDKSIWPTAYNTTLAYAKAGNPVSLVLSADGPDRLEFWAAGQYAGKIENPVANERLAKIIEQGLREAYALGFGSSTNNPD